MKQQEWYLTTPPPPPPPKSHHMHSYRPAFFGRYLSKYLGRDRLWCKDACLGKPQKYRDQHFGEFPAWERPGGPTKGFSFPWSAWASEKLRAKKKQQNTGRLGRPHQLQNHTPYGLHTCIQTLECVRSGHAGGGKQYKSFPLGKKFYFYADNLLFCSFKMAAMNTHLRVLLSKALSCDRLPEETWCSQQILAWERSSSAYMKFEHQISVGTYHT